MKSPAARAEERLRSFALGYPDTREEFPWGERALKVGGKVFVFMHLAERFRVTVKLPSSAGLALGLPFCSATGYGLGKAGWVTAAFERGDSPPLELLMSWIDESYRAVAPRKRVAELDARSGAGTADRRAETGADRPARAGAPRRAAAGAARRGRTGARRAGTGATRRGGARAARRRTRG